MASDLPGSSPASSKSESVQPSREDAETTATRKELRNTFISESHKDGLRPSTPEVSEDKVTPRDQISSPKKKRAHDQVEDDGTTRSGSFGVRVAFVVDGLKATSKPPNLLLRGPHDMMQLT